MASKPLDIGAIIRAASRKLHRGMPTGGRHGSKKGARGYNRKRTKKSSKVLARDDEE